MHIYQPPGDGNALGRLRFNFPNRFDVYQHDTPDKYLFTEERRAYSHGCMRVQDPASTPQLLLSIERPSDGYTEERIKRMFGSQEQDIQFPQPIPVHLTYQTAFVDDDGQLLIRAGHLRPRRPHPLRDQERSRHDRGGEQGSRPRTGSGPAIGAAASRCGCSRSGQSGPPSFFQALFGGGPRPPARRTALVGRSRNASSAEALGRRPATASIEPIRPSSGCARHADRGYPDLN